MVETRSSRRSWVAALLVAGLVVVGVPAAALAQQCTAPDGGPVNGSVAGIMNETIENPPAHAAPLGPLAAGTIANGSRLAQATENGALFGGCGALQGLQGPITVHARSKVSVGQYGLGVGDISGAFSVDTADGIVNGKLNGVLDFTLTNSNVTACGGPCPIVQAQGSWSTQGPTGQAGMFGGVALVPFSCDGSGAAPFCYLDPTGALPAVQGYAVLTVFPGPTGPLYLVMLNGATDFDKFGSPQAKFIISLFD